jgi:hypothetical protein
MVRLAVDACPSGMIMTDEDGEQHKSDIGQHARCNFSLERLSACRL